ncbi:MAG: hypothetical protein ACJA08_002926 [Cyclobacteriaceae bacterium]|jgi:hypothetical protein
MQPKEEKIGKAEANWPEKKQTTPITANRSFI